MGGEEDIIMMSEFWYEVGGTLCLQQKLVGAVLGN